MDDSITTIGEIADIFDGPHATPKKTEIGFYFLSISSLDKGRLDLSKSAYLSETDFKKWTKRVTPQKGDLLFSYETRLGEAALMPNGVRACLGRRMGLLRPKKNKVIPEYLLYAYLSPQFQQTIVSNRIRGATVDRIALNELPNFSIRIPCIEEQVKVASLLQAIDAKIECNNRINAELEAMAKTLYDYWFVQFDFPDENGKPYKSCGGKMVWNEELKRKIPEGWKVHKVGEMLEVSLGGTPSTSNVDYWEKGTINWLSSGEMNAFPVVEAKSKITEQALNNSAAKLMPNGTVAISITRYIRPTILAIDTSANQSVVGIHESSIFKSSYLYPHFVNEVSRYMIIRTGAMQPHINKETIKETPILKPTSQALNRYYEIATPIYQKIICHAQENLELALLRDWILPMLMNGQVMVQ